MRFEQTEENSRQYSVGELTKRFDVTRKTLFYYDRIGLLKPSSRTDNQKFKLYDSEKIERLEHILQYRDAGLQIAEIRLLLDGKDVDKIKIFTNAMQRLNKDEETLETAISALKKLIEAENLKRAGQ